MDVVTFSGDKMLGGPQCGILVGKREAVDRIKQNPLMRALRCDKITYLLLEETLKLFLNSSALSTKHPVMRMLTEPVDVVQDRATRLAKAIGAVSADIKVVDSAAQVGSGAMPVETIPSAAVTIVSDLTSNELSRRLRMGETPVVGYVRDEVLHLDVRTISEEEIQIASLSIRAALDPEWRSPCAT